MTLLIVSRATLVVPLLAMLKCTCQTLTPFVSYKLEHRNFGPVFNATVLRNHSPLQWAGMRAQVDKCKHVEASVPFRLSVT